MSDERKMTKEEREIAGRAVEYALKAVTALASMHDQTEELMLKYGWDCETWDISRAAMLAAKEGLGIAHTIGCEDGWAKESEAKNEAH